MTTLALFRQPSSTSVESAEETLRTTARSQTHTYMRNAVAGVARIFANALVAVALPSYLAHRLPVNTYSAWLLVIQLSAYISYLDVGVQTGVSKYIAEYMQRLDERGCSMAATAGFRILLTSAVLGLLAIPALAWALPHIFHSIPSALILDTRSGFVLIGLSLVASLACSIFPAIFLGLQRYEVPSTLAILNKLLYGVAVCVAVKLHGSMFAMGLTVAAINVATAIAQILVWRRAVPWVHVNVSLAGSDVLSRMLRYCSALTIWSAGMLCVGGLDLVLVGHYDFANTAFYAVAAAPSTFVIVLLSAVLGPLLPAVSALSVNSSPSRIGELLLSVTRYSVILLTLVGLPLVIWGGSILRLWVGPEYASHSLPLLRILIIANLIRNLLGPYSTFVIALGRQRVATVSPMTEAVLNLVSSILLARHFGAVGVAYGTLIGAIAGIAVHLTLSMRYTSLQIAVKRSSFITRGLLRPLILLLPCSLLLVTSSENLRDLRWIAAYFVSSLALLWFLCLDSIEHSRIKHFVLRTPVFTGVQP